MPWSQDPKVQALRLKYNVAIAAYQACAQALNEAVMAGSSTPELVEKEARARAVLDRARQELHDAMAAFVTPPADQSQESTRS